MNLTSASLTLVALIMINFTYASLNLWYSVATNVVDIVVWGVIVGYSIENKRCVNERV